MHWYFPSTRGMAVAPHALAAQSALDVLREGGNALEAMIAAAATIAVAYPHMNSIGGDSFWLVHVPGKAPGVIDASGAAARAATREWYAERGISSRIPFRGGVAANTVAGTVSGWGAAHELSRGALRGRMPLSRLLEDAIHYAERGIAVTTSQAVNTAGKKAELLQQPGFSDTFLVKHEAPTAGSLFTQKRLGITLWRIARAGTDNFYRGELAHSIAEDLQRAGSPLTSEDLAAHRAQLVDPLALPHSAGILYNTPPPTQGLVSLLILGILDELGMDTVHPATPDYVHLCVEATKQAFRVRDRHITDPAYMNVNPRDLLTRARIRDLAATIDRHRAAPWGAGKIPADTVWMGVIDGKGRAVGPSPPRAVTTEPTPTTAERPAARRVFGETAIRLRDFLVSGRWRLRSPVSMPDRRRARGSSARTCSGTFRPCFNCDAPLKPYAHFFQ